MINFEFHDDRKKYAAIALAAILSNPRIDERKAEADAVAAAAVAMADALMAKLQAFKVPQPQDEFIKKLWQRCLDFGMTPSERRAYREFIEDRIRAAEGSLSDNERAEVSVDIAIAVDFLAGNAFPADLSDPDPAQWYWSKVSEICSN